eukprot:SAG31_NODE_2865_length_4981_cov_4.988529_7_plen_121_part_00
MWDTGREQLRPLMSGTPQQSGKEYLERHRVAVYLRDAISLLLATKPDRPIDFLANYYRQLRRGEHVAHRNFEYVNSTPQNRRCFIRLFSNTFADVETCQLGPLSAAAELTFADYLALQQV